MSMSKERGNVERASSLNVEDSEVERECHDEQQLIERVPGVRKPSKPPAGGSMAGTVGKKYVEIAIVVAVYW